MTPTAGFIGLGNIGRPMAARIAAAGLPLRLWARRPVSLDGLLGGNVQASSSPRELGAACDVVGLCVRTAPEVLDVALREGDGLLGGMKPGSVLLVHATAPPEAVMDLDAAARRRGVHLLDAPVSGGATGAQAGTLTVLLGGDEAAIAKARPVLETFAANLLHVGAAGAAQRLKLLNNNLCYANVAMALAALDLAQALGVDRAAAASVIRVSSGASHAFGLIVDPNQVAKMAGPTSNVRKDVDHLMALLTTRGLDGGLLMAASCTAADRVSAYAQAGAPESP